MVKLKLTNEDILSIPNLYESGLSSWEVAKKFNTSHSNILHHLKRLNIRTRDRSSAAKEGVRAGRIIIKKHKIPENLSLNQDLAYILGVLVGDGYMDYSNKRRAYHIGLSAIDKEIVEEFKRALNNFFKIKPTNEFRKSRKVNWNDQFITRLCSKEACDFINSIGQFKKDNWIVPELIIAAEDSIKLSFIKGFFDSEGELDKKTGRVGATSMNLYGLTQISNLLISFNMRNTIIALCIKQ